MVCNSFKIAQNSLKIVAFDSIGVFNPRGGIAYNFWYNPEFEEFKCSVTPFNEL